MMHWCRAKVATSSKLLEKTVAFCDNFFGSFNFFSFFCCFFILWGTVEKHCMIFVYTLKKAACSLEQPRVRFAIPEEIKRRSYECGARAEQRAWYQRLQMQSRCNSKICRNIQKYRRSSSKKFSITKSIDQFAIQLKL